MTFTLSIAELFDGRFVACGFTPERIVGFPFCDACGKACSTVLFLALETARTKLYIDITKPFPKTISKQSDLHILLSCSSCDADLLHYAIIPLRWALQGIGREERSIIKTGGYRHGIFPEQAKAFYQLDKQAAWMKLARMTDYTVEER